jgi:hypothetical protein
MSECFYQALARTRVLARSHAVIEHDKYSPCNLWSIVVCDCLTTRALACVRAVREHAQYVAHCGYL